jgi:U3 small nucleolar RNA-associated protein 15
VLTPAQFHGLVHCISARVQTNNEYLSCREALDAALATQRPEIVHSMLEELASRAGLHAALAGRSPQQLLPLLRHLSRHITDPRHSQVLAGVAARVLDLYATSVHADAEVSQRLLH